VLPKAKETIVLLGNDISQLFPAGDVGTQAMPFPRVITGLFFALYTLHKSHAHLFLLQLLQFNGM